MAISKTSVSYAEVKDLLNLDNSRAIDLFKTCQIAPINSECRTTEFMISFSPSLVTMGEVESFLKNAKSCHEGVGGTLILIYPLTQ
jgi:hypothetical protein